MDAVNPRPPTQTAHVILGLLSHGNDLSGYELRLWAERSLGAFYKTPAQSQIYTELAKLSELGLVTARSVVQSDNPDKVVYTLTAEGRAVLDRWLATAPVVPAVVKHPLAVQTSFSAGVDPGILVDRLDAYIDATIDTLAQLEDLVVGLDDGWGLDDQAAVDRRALTVAVLGWATAIRQGDLAGARGVRDVLAGR